MLPDSNVNEPESRGYFFYKIKAKSSLILEDVIENTAYIYFDFNALVVTNTTETEVALITGIAGEYDEGSIKRWPNPAQNQLYVEWEESSAVQQVEILDQMGRKIMQKKPSMKSVVDSRIALDIAELPAGVYFVRCSNSVARFVKIVN